MSDLAPISFECRLACGPAEAFATYTDRIGEWWDPRYSANADTFAGVTIEPRAGGRVYEHHRGGAEYEWGEVTAWEPGERLVHSFALAQDPAHPSEVAVEFVPTGEGSLVRFEHRGWSEENMHDRRKFGDWPVLLDRFAALASPA